MRQTVPLEETPGLAMRWCRHLGFDVAARFEPSGDDRLFPNRLSLSGGDAALLLAGKPQPLDALQYLLHEAQGGRDDAGLAYLDAQGARLFRMKELLAMTQMAAKKAREVGSFAFGSLTPKERRWVHIALGSEGDLETHSEGEGAIKSLKVTRKAE
jgi:predicted RNA-binding protein Jag